MHSRLEFAVQLSGHVVCLDQKLVLKRAIKCCWVLVKRLSRPNVLNFPTDVDVYPNYQLVKPVSSLDIHRGCSTNLSNNVKKAFPRAGLSSSEWRKVSLSLCSATFSSQRIKASQYVSETFAYDRTSSVQ